MPTLRDRHPELFGYSRQKKKQRDFKSSVNKNLKKLKVKDLKDYESPKPGIAEGIGNAVFGALSLPGWALSPEGRREMQEQAPDPMAGDPYAAREREVIDSFPQADNLDVEQVEIEKPQKASRVGAGLGLLFSPFIAGKEIALGPAASMSEDGGGFFKGLGEGINRAGLGVGRDVYALANPEEAAYADETLHEQGAASRIATSAGAPEAALGIDLLADAAVFGGLKPIRSLKGGAKSVEASKDLEIALSEARAAKSQGAPVETGWNEAWEAGRVKAAVKPTAKAASSPRRTASVSVGGEPVKVQVSEAKAAIVDRDREEFLAKLFDREQIQKRFMESIANAKGAAPEAAIPRSEIPVGRIPVSKDLEGGVLGGGASFSNEARQAGKVDELVRSSANKKISDEAARIAEQEALLASPEVTRTKGIAEVLDKPPLSKLSSALQEEISMQRKAPRTMAPKTLPKTATEDAVLGRGDRHTPYPLRPRAEQGNFVEDEIALALERATPEQLRAFDAATAKYGPATARELLYKSLERDALRTAGSKASKAQRRKMLSKFRAESTVTSRSTRDFPEELGKATPKQMAVAGGLVLGAGIVAAAPEDERYDAALAMASIVGPIAAGAALVKWAPAIASKLSSLSSENRVRIAAESKKLRETGRLVTRTGFDEGAASIDEGLSPIESASKADFINSSQPLPPGAANRTSAEIEHHARHREYPAGRGNPLSSDPWQGPRNIPGIKQWNDAVAKHGPATDSVKATFYDNMPIVTADQAVSKTKQGLGIVDRVQEAVEQGGALYGEMLVTGPSAELSQRLGATPGTWPLKKILGLMNPEEQKIFVKALDGKLDSATKAAIEAGKMQAVEAAIFKGREWLDSMANILKLKPGQRLKDYFPHIFDRDLSLAKIDARLKELKTATLTQATRKEYEGLKSLRKGLSNQPKGYIPEWVLNNQSIPNEAFFGNAEARLANLSGYMEDAAEVLPIYAKGLIRKAMYDKYAPELEAAWNEIRSGRALDAATGKPLNVDRSYESYVRKYLDHFAGNAGPHKLAEGTLDANFPVFGGIDPATKGKFASFFSTWNHHLLLGNNPAFAIRNTLAAPAGTVGFVGFTNAGEAIAELPKLLDKNSLVSRMSRYIGLSGQLPHEEWVMVKALKGGAKADRLFSLGSHGSETLNRHHSAIAGLKHYQKMWDWGINNYRLISDPGRIEEAAEIFRKSGKMLRDKRLSPAEQLRDLQSAITKYKKTGDVATKEQFLFDGARWVSRNSQHAYGVGAPTGLKVAIGKDPHIFQMGLMYQTWFSKQANMFWSKLDALGKAKFLAYTVAVGGAKSAPVIQWAVDAVPAIKTWMQAHVTDPDDQLLPPTVKLALGGALGQHVPNLGSALGQGQVPDILNIWQDPKELGANANPNVASASRIAGTLGQVAGGPVLGTLAKGAANVVGAGVTAPAHPGHAMAQEAGKQRLPVPAAVDMLARSAMPGGRPNTKGSGLITALFGNTPERQGLSASVNELENQDKLRERKEKLVIDVALERNGEDLESAMSEIESELGPGVVTVEQVTNRKRLLSVPPEIYWPIFSRNPEGTEDERRFFEKAANSIKESHASAPWAEKALASLQEKDIRSRYKQEVAKGKDADISTVLGLHKEARELGFTLGKAGLFDKRGQIVIRAVKRFQETGKLPLDPKLKKQVLQFANQ